VRMFPVIRII